MLGIRRRKSEILEDKSKFADDIKNIWTRENYESIKTAHNEIIEYLQEKDFDFFSVQYLLTMTYMELLINEYLKSHSDEIQKKLITLIGNSAKSDESK
jgi:hypothetical protein